MASREVIDQAVGIMMSRTGISPEEARARIRVLSQSENAKMSVVAAGIVREAVRRARARRVET